MWIANSSAVGMYRGMGSGLGYDANDDANRYQKGPYCALALGTQKPLGGTDSY